MLNFMTYALFGLVLLFFNIPVILLVLRLPVIADLKQALNEKDPIGGATDTTSYSRVTGLIGAVILTSFFWALGNIVIFKAFEGPDDIDKIVKGTEQLFLVGAALFLPYAFNQIKSAFGASATAAASVSAPAPSPAVGPAAPQLNLIIANLSSAISDTEFAAAVAAIGIQVSRDFQPEWGCGAKLTTTRLALTGQPNINAATDAIIYVGDSSSDPTTGVTNALGYHSANFGDTPYGFIYLDVCAQYGEVWTCTLSHEVLELLGDPDTTKTVTGPAPAQLHAAANATVAYDLEVCDPTQGDTYIINSVTVSNFVSRAYFNMPGGMSATNYLNLALQPFGVRPNGYFQYELANGTSDQVNGQLVTPGKIAARAILGAQRRNGRRATALMHRV